MSLRKPALLFIVVPGTLLQDFVIIVSTDAEIGHEKPTMFRHREFFCRLGSFLLLRLPQKADTLVTWDSVANVVL